MYKILTILEVKVTEYIVKTIISGQDDLSQNNNSATYKPSDLSHVTLIF